MKKAVCFFAHCWDDDDKLLHYLKAEVERKSQNRVEVILDKTSFLVSDNFLKCEEQLISCDTVAVFFTPAYKTVVTSEQTHRGVYREYKHISSIFSHSERKIIPLLKSGDKSSSIPALFENNIYKDISTVSLVDNKKTGKTTITHKDRAEVNNLVSLIIKRTEEIAKFREFQFDNDIEKYENILYMQNANGKLPMKCMVRVAAYDSIIAQTNMFVVGRKGSGKSTLFEVLQKYNIELFSNRYKSLKPINADAINMGSLYTVFKKYVSDFDIIDQNRILSLFWETFIIFYTMYIIGLEEENHQILDTERRRIFKKVTNKLKKALNIDSFNTERICEGLYIMAVEKVDDFLSEGIFEYATTESLLASITLHTSSTKLMRRFFGNKAYNDFVCELSTCRKIILFALDGFDYVSEDFRMDTKHMLRQRGDSSIKTEGLFRAHFSRLFYRSLMTSISEIKNKGSVLSNVLHFCIVLPKDRLDEIESVHRDMSKTKLISLDWDAINLLEMLVLRLEYIGEIEFDEKKDLMDRFEYAMKKNLPTIPEQIHFEINGINKSMDIMQYLLSLSIWRPRDILVHFSHLFEIDKKTKALLQKRVSNDVIKQTLTGATDKIIKLEFIKEYENVFLNISSVLRELHGSDFVSPANIFQEKLSEIDFITSFDIDCSKTINKISVLYELGLIGLLFTEKFRISNGLSFRYCYIFNAGLKPIELIKRGFEPDMYEIDFVFNPMFIKYLSLNMNTNDLVGAFGWEYLQQNHQMRTTLARF